MSLLKMSLSGAVMILVICVVRVFLINRIPKRTFLILWGITAVRLLIPYSMPAVCSVYSLAENLTARWEAGGFAVGAEGTATGRGDIEGAGGAWQPVGDAVLEADSAAGSGDVPQKSALNQNFRLRAALMTVWATGASVFAGFFLMSWLKCRREFRESLPVNNSFARAWLREHPLRRQLEIRQSDKISAPLTYGVLRPVILVPKRTDWRDEETYRYVLAHEYVHIRRLDAVSKLVLTFSLCIHWFDPLVWVMYLLANRDIELSCDEAVIRLFGEDAKAAYALTLIRMEETRGDLRPLYNNFSRNAAEERMIAIMKTKKTSRAAGAAAFMLVAGVTAAFATTGQTAAAQDNESPLSAEGAVRRLNADAGTVCEESTVLSYFNREDGRTYYSWDGGESWTPLTDAEFQELYPALDVEWWTAEEYAAWLEQEKLALQSCVGDKGWNPTEGWYTMTQEWVDDAIALYEKTLYDIQNGMKVSRTVYGEDGDAVREIMMAYSPENIETVADDTLYTQDSATVQGEALPEARTPGAELLAEYGKYGLTCDEAREFFYYNGKTVRYFFDGYTIENGVAVIYEYFNEDGVVDIHTIRQATDNADGSYDPGGRLMGIEEYSQEELENRAIMSGPVSQEADAAGKSGGQEAIAQGTSESGDTGTDFLADFAKYEPFGVTFVKSGNFGNVYYNGELVDVLVDRSPEGAYMTVSSSDEGGIVVQAVYDSNGKLAGVETVMN